MPIKTATLDDLILEYLRIMSYGAPGVGKSHFLQFLPDPFVLDIDRGLTTLLRLPERPKNVQFLPRPGAPALSYDQLMLVVSQIAGRPQEFGKTIVLDNLSELERQLLSEEALKNKRPDGIPDQNDYRPVHTKLFNLLLALKQLPMHLYVTAGEITERDRAGNISHLYPDLSKRNQAVFPRMFDEVYYFTQSGPGDYTILTTGDGIAYAKSRLRMPKGLSHKGLADTLLKLVTPRSEDPKVVPLRKEEV